MTVWHFVLLGTHCLVEWEEPGNPHSVVQRKSIRGTFEVGERCDVELRIGHKRSCYKARILAIGEIHVHPSQGAPLHLTERLKVTAEMYIDHNVGDKHSMDRKITEMREKGDEDYGDEVDMEQDEPGATATTEPAKIQETRVAGIRVIGEANTGDIRADEIGETIDDEASENEVDEISEWQPVRIL